MKQLLIFLFVFVSLFTAQIAYAASDAEMLPRVMGQLKKDLDSSKTWEDFLNKTQVMGFAEMMMFDQLVGLKKPLPKYSFSSNLRTLTVGDHKFEVVNLSSSDFLIDGKPFRVQQGEAYYESLERRMSRRYTSAWNLLLLPVAMAQPSRPMKTPNKQSQVQDKEAGMCPTRLLNQFATEDGFKKEAKNEAANLGQAAMISVSKNTTFEKQARVDQNCSDMIEGVRAAQKEVAKIVGIDCSTKQISFKVPGTFASEGNKTNKYGISDPYRGEAYSQAINKSNKGAMPVLKEFKVRVNFSNREFAELNPTESYFYNERGFVAVAELFTPTGGKPTVSCSFKITDTEKEFQVRNVASVIQAMGDKCERNECSKEFKELAEENLKSIGAGNAPVITTTQLENSRDCDIRKTRYLSGCMRKDEMAEYQKTCGRTLTLPKSKCMPAPAEANPAAR